MLNQISTVLSTLHACSHLSFIVTGHYPRIRRQPRCYALLGASDVLAHALAASRGYKIGAAMVVWHVFKGYMPRYRSHAVMNMVDCLAHGVVVTAESYPIPPGIVLYFGLRALDLVW